MKALRDICIGPQSSIRDAISRIDAGAVQLALVVDEQLRLLGTVTDGDVRRSILRGVGLDEAVARIMNPSPTVVESDADRSSILALMSRKQLRHVPVVDSNGRVLGVETINDLLQPIPVRDNAVLLMAGGLGTRLRPLTQDCPKPMLRVGDRPILETILLSFIDFGFRQFYVSVNYRADAIKEHFGNGEKWGVQIEYLWEHERMGTAGALSLLPKRPDKPIFVMNGDLLTKVNLEHLMDFHVSNSAQATMCVREFDYQVPYGVLKLDGVRLVQIEEKPVQRFFVNAGIYVLDPSVLDLVPNNVYFDMPSLFNRLLELGKVVAAFPIREYWIDIGRHDDLNRANVDFSEEFDT